MTPFCTALLRLVLGLAIATSVAGCGQPCRELSETVCGCMPTLGEQEACKQRVKAIEAQRPKQPDDKSGDEVCQALLEGCSCAALARGDLAACGLAVE